jgi:hypothetical protein
MVTELEYVFLANSQNRTKKHNILAGGDSAPDHEVVRATRCDRQLSARFVPRDCAKVVVLRWGIFIAVICLRPECGHRTSPHGLVVVV